MHKFQGIALSLIFILTIAVSLTHFFGNSTRSASPITVLFTNADGTLCPLPCLFGVQTIQRSYAETMRLLHAHPFLRNFQPGATENVLLGEQVSVIVNLLRPGNPVERIAIWKRPKSPELGDWGSFGQVITFLGAPEHIEVGQMYTWSAYDADHLQFFHRHHFIGQISPEDQLETLTLFTQLTTQPIRLGQDRWRGFTKYYPYQEVLP